ncbi:hypothetical protein VOLCADRAFT_93182 [Volvox carteri f. nagariensis]|uniref:Uncharacterized protein n=1 Tax=Volvox carteri f. nagariensis TaxID=3068 RepID=D8U1I2_VOLCA|nr:uncharacterized protein VOLCADRAFT_93182 [Volvox carteri f. nagariensis]EFJ46414.1 hypothetical protein VOLCADRAFT_93182 [Volvox carteri f. nagariensis]|eukprot:XP_002952567.1 hypothetical protein VOLCADRAFT_93182 [Volvox carteri f. nagariensis]
MAVKADAQAEQLDTAMLRLIAGVSKQVDEAVAATVFSNNEAAKRVIFSPDSDLRQRVVASIQKLAKGLLERDVEACSKLGLFPAPVTDKMQTNGHSAGTAKSELSARLSSLCGGTYFERLLTRFSVPEELFGPLSMKGLENDLYVRQINGYLPTAEVAFVDEIFKANSAILNALLTLLNERLFDNGNQRLHAPLLCLVGASNEMPESEELDALYDRFLIRRTVSQVSNNQLYKLARLAAGRNDHALTGVTIANGNGGGSEAVQQQVLSMDDFRGTATTAYSAVDVPDSVIDLLTGLRNHLQAAGEEWGPDKCEPPMYVSDRRFMKAIRMLQVAAYADGRDQVNEYDCLMLEHVFGNRPDDGVKVRQQVLDMVAADPGLQQAELVLLGLFGRTCRLLEGPEDAAELAAASAEVAQLVDLLSSRHAALAANLEGNGFPELRATLWQAEASVAAAVQALVPQMTENRKKVEDLLREAQTLAAVLRTPSASAPLLERLLPKRFKQYQKGISAKV